MSQHLVTAESCRPAPHQINLISPLVTLLSPACSPVMDGGEDLVAKYLLQKYSESRLMQDCQSAAAFQGEPYQHLPD